MTLIDKAEALLPCPFCGGDDMIILNGPVEDDWCTVSCEKCHARGPIDYTDPHAIAAWDRRALPARGVVVRPLVWQFEQEDVQVANTSARHQYRVIHDRRATKGAWSWFCDGAWIGCETEEAAKAAAQADYEARILAALEPALAPTDAAQARDAALWEAWNVVWEAKTLLDAKNALHALIGEAK